MLLGRQPELKRLNGALSAARRGESGVLIVRGEPGIGKSALLAQATGNARGLRVLTAAGVESESALPFAALSQLLHPVVDRLDRLPAPQAKALGGALALGPPSPGDPFTVSAGTLSLLAAAAEEAPLLAVVDDAHWLDASSAAALAFVARRLGADGIAVVVATRQEDDVFRASGLPELVLGGLDRQSADVLVTRVAKRDVSPSVLEQIYAASAGNPLGLVEIPTLLTEGQLAATEPLVEPPPVGQAVERAFLRQLESVSAGMQSGLLVAAAADSDEIRAIQAACRELGVDPGLLETAEEAGLVHLHAETLRFRHPLLRAAVYQSASATARRGAHAALAQATEGDRRAWHLAAAAFAPDETVAQALAEAALTARLRGGISESARAFERAAQLTLDKERRVERLLEAAAGYLLAGRLDRGFALLDEALALAIDPRVRAEIQHLRGRGQLFSGSPMDARALLTTEAERIASLDPDKAALMLVDAAFACFTTVLPKLALEHAERAYELARGPARLAATARLAEALVYHGQDERVRQLLERARVQLDREDVLVVSGPATSGAYAWMVVEDYAAAEALLVRMVTGARSAGAPAALPLPLAFLSELEFRAGRWTQASAYAAEAAELAEQTGQMALLGYALACNARMHAACGREAQFERDMASALALGARFGIASLTFLAGSGHALLLLPQGKIAEAIRHLDAVARLVEAAGSVDPGVSLWQGERIEALVHAGERGQAESELSKLEQMTDRAGRPGMLAISARCRGLLADDDVFEDEFAAALAWHDRSSMPFERARTELALGVRRRRVGRRLQAREPLRAALGTFDRLGARLWAELARAEIRATGEAVRARREARSEELTAQELQIALTVARGATNREAAEAHFLSPKTIEYHLGHAYRKLGIRSRTELARCCSPKTTSATAARWLPGLRAQTPRRELRIASARGRARRRRTRGRAARAASGAT